LSRLALRRLAGAPIRTDEILAVAGRGGTVTLDVGQGLRAVVEYGHVRFDTGPQPPPDPVSTTEPGTVRFGDWQVDVSVPAMVRSWKPGDRIRTSGGTKLLQDLFTDSKVPREERARVPVVEADGEVRCVGDLVSTAGFAARRVT
jgi:tRNA(Ile)-lysidine synthetase-like protein